MATKLRIRAEKLEAKHLNPGDLFSMDEIPSEAMNAYEVVTHVRANGALPAELRDTIIYKITFLGKSRQKETIVTTLFNPHIPPGLKEWDI